jgi:tagaturonate reductase
LTNEAAKPLPCLNAEYLKNQLQPERVLQFGEGNFLRGFVDWMIDTLNRKGLFNGRVVVVQPIARGQAGMLNEQNGVYTLLMRGMLNGEAVENKQIITSISRAINPYEEFQTFLDCAHNPNLRFIVSNTTEAGIAFSAEDKPTDQPPSSFPAKLTLLLLERYKAFNGDVTKGFILLPCELISHNGDNLKKTVLQTAENWKLDPEFIAWIEKANIFTSTLVDRIVTGYPRDVVENLWKKAGYKDNLFDTCEAFHLWVIQGPESIEKELPLKKAGLNVVYTDDITPYRNRKVRILNGAHTSTMLAAYLSGKDFVGDSMDDPILFDFMQKAIYEEVFPTLPLTKKELSTFAEAVFERFRNPFVHHPVLSISLNSVSKYKARVLGSLQDYLAAKGKIPTRLAFGLAALIAFYRGTEIKDGALIGHRDGKEYQIKDDSMVLETFAKTWKDFDGSDAAIARVVDSILKQKGWWGKDLREIPGFAKVIVDDLTLIEKNGMKAAISSLK